MNQMQEFIKLSGNALPLLILKGLPVTFCLSVVALCLALLTGIVFGIMGNSKISPFPQIARVYVYIFRNVPFLIFVYIIFYLLPMININLDPFPTAVLALFINHGAYIAELIRGGLNTIKKEQKEAAISLGLNYVQRFQKVILPQVLMEIAPSVVGQTTLLIKDTSIISVIGIIELTCLGREIVVRTYSPFLIFFYVAVLYFVLCYALQKLSDWTEKKVKRYIMAEQ
jgi:His/Glu/Gln/Arg/opine family amino acid ABC transporter permease subunit